jgi:integrase
VSPPYAKLKAAAARTSLRLLAATASAASRRACWGFPNSDSRKAAAARQLPDNNNQRHPRINPLKDATGAHCADHQIGHVWFLAGSDEIDIRRRMVEEYRDYRRRQPSQRNPKIDVKGATVNREIEWLQCVCQFAVTRKYIAESPAAGVRHFDERRERPAKRMLTVEEEQSIFETAPPYLRVAIVLLVQTGGRTYSEGLSLRWDQVDLENQVIHLAGELKTSESAQPTYGGLGGLHSRRPAFRISRSTICGMSSARD